MSFDPEQEHRRLAKLYAEMSEGELREIAADAPELTDLARQALLAEISQRGADIQLAEPAGGEYPDLQETVTLRRFRDLPEALVAKSALDSAGIDCFLIDANMVRIDWFYSNLLGGIKLQVKKDDAEEALAVLNGPVPETFDIEGIGVYQQPRCPRCSSLDTRQNWQGRRTCQSCGYEWQETDSDETPPQA